MLNFGAKIAPFFVFSKCLEKNVRMGEEKAQGHEGSGLLLYYQSGLISLRVVGDFKPSASEQEAPAFCILPKGILAVQS